MLLLFRTIWKRKWKAVVNVFQLSTRWCVFPHPASDYASLVFVWVTAASDSFVWICFKAQELIERKLCLSRHSPVVWNQLRLGIWHETQLLFCLCVLANSTDRSVPPLFTLFGILEPLCGKQLSHPVRPTPAHPSFSSVGVVWVGKTNCRHRVILPHPASVQCPPQLALRNSSPVRFLGFFSPTGVLRAVASCAVNTTWQRLRPALLWFLPNGGKGLHQREPNTDSTLNTELPGAVMY